jgi:hypothetical protein
MHAKNRYLVGPSGRAVGSRVPAALATFGGLLGGPLLFVIGGLSTETFVNRAHRDDVLGGSMLAALFLFFATGITLVVWIVSSSRRLREAEPLALAGDLAAGDLARYPLPRVFRPDVRIRAFYTLGLLAERRGDFVEAADLFARARDLRPMVLGTEKARRAMVMVLGHLAFCQAAAGRLTAAGQSLTAVHTMLPRMGPGAFGFLVDDSMWLGPVSTTTMYDVEPRRDARAMVVLAGALLAFKNGHYRACVDAAGPEVAMLRQNLLPDEGALYERVSAEALARLSGGEYRGGGPSGSGNAWADAALAPVPPG